MSSAATEPRLLTACAPGEPHEVGLLLFALSAQEAGYQPIVLGACTPFAELIAVHRRARCSALVISCTLDPTSDVLEDIPKLVARAGVPVFVGGAGAATCGRALQRAGAAQIGAKVEAGVRLLDRRLHAIEQSGSG